MKEHDVLSVGPDRDHEGTAAQKTMSCQSTCYDGQIDCDPERELFLTLISTQNNHEKNTTEHSTQSPPDTGTERLADIDAPPSSRAATDQHQVCPQADQSRKASREQAQLQGSPRPETRPRCLH